MTAKDILPGQLRGERLPEPVWRMKPLVLSHLAAIIIVGSWLWPVSRGWWDQLDVAVFKVLNGSLAYADWWQTLWAFGNIRLMDVFSGALLLVILISWLWGRPRDVQNMKIATLGALVAFLVVIPQVSHTVIQSWFGYLRHSPTLVVDGALRLSKLVPTLNAKDVSISSFPGDHAYTLFILMIFFWYLGPRRYAVTVSILALILMMPRMIGGAHWMTDSVIGGGVPALLAVSWLLATPLGFYMAGMLLPLVKFINAVIPEWLRIPERMAS
ncbi:MAG: phosphatase PAP2 family protein [Alphaproteobacteria bacterium]